MLQYILECVSFQLVFLIIYDLFLKRETFFQWNRLYLIGTYIISMILPWIKIEAMKTTVPKTFQGYPEFLWSTNDIAVTATAIEETSFIISWEYVVLFGGMFLATLFFGYKLFQIYTLKRKGEVHYFKDFTQIIISNSSMAFSFFKSIFLGDKVIEKEHQSIVQHELVHIRQRHSYDLMFFELMRIVGWFNPLVYVYQSRVSELHEFIADAQVAKTNKKEQYEFLLSQVFQTQNISFINQFFKTSLIKKRIVMLQKAQSKKIWQLKYLLLLPMVFGMLAYTSAEQHLDDDIEQINQTTNDAELISEIKSEIEKEIARVGSLEKVFFRLKNTEENISGKIFPIYKKRPHVLSKKEYFKEQLLHKMFFENFKGVEFGDDVLPRKPLPKMPLPSTSRYENYLSRKEAFFILDPNLQFSVKAYDQQINLIDIKPNYENSSFLFEVENVKDLTGNELRMFNNKLEEILEQEGAVYSDLILTDGIYAFLVSKGLPKKDLSSYANSTAEGLVERFDKKIMLSVYDNRHLSKGEKAQQEELLDEIRTSKEMDTLLITDGKYSTKITSNSDGDIFIEAGKESDPVAFAKVDNVPVFPGCENENDKRACFQQKIQKHISNNFNYPKEAQEREIQGRVNVMFMISKKGNIEGLRMRGPDSILEKEVARIINKLPKMKPGKHKGKKVDVPFSIPVVFKLDTKSTFEKLPVDSNQFGPKLAAATRQYNELVAERNRLLKSTNEKNPIIVNLDEQLKSLKESLRSSLEGSVDSFSHNGGGGLTVDELSIEQAKEQYDLLRSERERLLVGTNDKNPIIVNLDQQIKALKIAIDQEGETVPFATIDEVPVFPGCEDAENKRKCFNEKMQKHISKNFNYPKEAQEKGIQGRVAVMFTIAIDGSIQNIRKRGPDPLLENEVERIIKRLPKMKPGKQKGKAVNVPFSIPVTFKLQGDTKSTDSKSLDIVKLGLGNGNDPIYFVDGKESSKEELSLMTPDDIESISVLKGESAKALYGEKGKNGVIQIITKKKD
ncbi:TonB family protein [Maribacter algarum]|uniref:TonB family protein n=1 Tax=Maribacter algarum (ex Zhang et al. 2020) TaxID=2578118 RepID=A0A5S3PTR6_9FLAO|nr:M56 family metallopeptidase [Maribacter algarum]TMM58375.1 TonB family protein [Maribacter algarum]